MGVHIGRLNIIKSSDNYHRIIYDSKDLKSDKSNISKKKSDSVISTFTKGKNFLSKIMLHGKIIVKYVMNEGDDHSIEV